jgi:hypothetical protein
LPAIAATATASALAAKPPDTKESYVKALLCIGLMLLMAGCIPIGIRGSTQLASAACVASVA